ncbi:HD domain-containing protein C4G3.17 [Golovinomyces cichoracearum]|uniref:5'-deoxynucleotidase n=1 Tax=Golovinomyces cichoracearum TaxID=62708 RepID=A0A420IWL1_9PEZI|nr:HD domain-containing protein C4G3.17 [Golovinomyces cichoracearum]
MTSSKERLIFLPGGREEVSSRPAQRLDQSSRTIPKSATGYTKSCFLTEKLDTLDSQSASPKWLVQDVAARLPNGAPQEGSDSPVSFFHILERLKTTPREGWRRFGKKNGESISDHMYRMAMMAMFAPEPLRGLLDIQRCTNMALIHDMAEALVGDITPVEGISKEEKNRRETTTMDFLTKNILGNVEGGRIAQNIRSLWQEYEDGVTLESKFVHDLDKIELILQMVEYERASACKCDLGEFTWVHCKIILPETKAWAKTILDEREELWGGREHVSYTAIEDPEDIMEMMLGKSYQTKANNTRQNGTKSNGSS